jgi:hypothetical protein
VIQQVTLLFLQTHKCQQMWKNRSMEGSNFPILLLMFLFIYFCRICTKVHSSTLLDKGKIFLTKCWLARRGNCQIAQWRIHFVILLFSLFMAKKDISLTLTINKLVLFLLVGCEIASLDMIRCGDLTFLLPIMFDRRAFPVRMLPFAESTINTTTWHTTWQRKKKGRHKLI